jgi:predicted 2-oxoglutarate/Fe(II)-dependent dioxygenase YbiX
MTHIPFQAAMRPNGLPAPIFRPGLAPDWRQYSFDWQAGRPAAIVISHAAPATAVQPLLAAFAAEAAAFRGPSADILLVSTAPLLSDFDPQGGELVPCEARFLVESGVPPGAIRIAVVDRNMRVIDVLIPTDPAATVACCLRLLRETVPETPPPILILPNLLPHPMCRDLIAHFEGSESVESEVAGLDADGRPRNYVDHAIKRRRDVQLLRDDPRGVALHALLLARCAPEVEKAFGARIAYTDRLMLARYDAPSGVFRRHRDNATPRVAFREFAISINLDAGSHTGGGLHFPEYSDRPFTAPTGGGLIFSASLLHEVAPVTQGRRYALLSFFHSEAAERRRHP